MQATTMMNLTDKKNVPGGKAYPKVGSSDCSSTAHAITRLLSKNQPLSLDMYLTITDRKETSNDSLTGLHVLTLLLLAAEFPGVINICQNYAMKVGKLTIVSDVNQTREQFCSEPDNMYQTSKGIIRRRVRADGEADYVVDVPELETTYEMGDFTYIFIMSTSSQQEHRQIAKDDKVIS
jgi:hypothetical protein